MLNSFIVIQIDWHLSSGLAAVFIEAPEKFQENTVVPQTIFDHCKYWGLPTSGNVVGLNSTTDFDGQPWGPFPLVIVRPSLPSIHHSMTLADLWNKGWTPAALTSIFFCVTTAVIGIATVLWYNQDTLDSRDMEEHIRRKIEAKKRRSGLLRRLRGE